MTNYTTYTSAQTPTKPRWWQRQRFVLTLVCIALIIATLAWVGNTEETLLLALDANNGRGQWSLSSPTGMRQAGLGIPLAANGRVYVSVVTPPDANHLLPNYTWELRALDAASGSLLWTFKADPAQFGKVAPQLTARFTPVVTQDTLYFSLINLDYQSWIVALDVQTGAVKWSKQDLFFSDESLGGLSEALFDSTYYPKFTVVGDKLFALLRNETTDAAQHASDKLPVAVVALNPQTGELLWNTPLTLKKGEADAVVPILVSDGQQVYFTGEQTYVFDAQTGAAKPTEPEAFVVVTEDAVYKQRGTTLTAINRASGQQRWEVTLADVSCGLFTVSQQNVYRICAKVEEEDMTEPDTDDSDPPPSEWSAFFVVLDVQTGVERWHKPIASNPYTVLTQLPSTYGDRITLVGGVLGNLRVMTLDADGNELWSYRVERGYEQTITDGNRIYVIDTRLRWRGWLAAINPAWR